MYELKKNWKGIYEQICWDRARVLLKKKTGPRSHKGGETLPYSGIYQTMRCGPLPWGATEYFGILFFYFNLFVLFSQTPTNLLGQIVIWSFEPSYLISGCGT
jgi:hypothetical protein